MMALAIEIGLRKKGKANRPSEFRNDTIGILFKNRTKKSGVTRMSRNKRLRHGEQVNRNFGIKPFLSQNWGHVFTPKFGKKNAGTQNF